MEAAQMTAEGWLLTGIFRHWNAQKAISSMWSAEKRDFSQSNQYVLNPGKKIRQWSWGCAEGTPEWEPSFLVSNTAGADTTLKLWYKLFYYVEKFSTAFSITPILVTEYDTVSWRQEDEPLYSSQHVPWRYVDFCISSQKATNNVPMLVLALNKT